MQPVGGPPVLERVRAAAGQLGVTLQERQAQQLVDYLGLLQRWNAVHNLTSLQGGEEMLIRLVFDSLSLVAALTRYAAGRALRVLDVGSGSGFPAAGIAVARPNWPITALDAIAKKVAFVQQAASACGIANLHAICARVESLAMGKRFDVIVSKAFGSLAALVLSSDQVLNKGGVWVAQKGKPPKAEMEALPSGFEVFHVEPVTVPHLDEERCLVWLRRNGGR